MMAFFSKEKIEEACYSFATEVEASVVISTAFTLPFKYVRAQLAASRSIFVTHT